MLHKSCTTFDYFFYLFSESQSSINQKVMHIHKDPVHVEVIAISPEEIGSIVINNITSRSEGGSLTSNDLNELISTNHTHDGSNETIRLVYGTNVTYTISKTAV